MALTTTPLLSYQHTQGVPAMTWTINHNLGGYPVVDVYVTHEGVVQKIMPQAITFVNPNTVTVSFAVSTGGFATVVV